MHCNFPFISSNTSEGSINIALWENALVAYLPSSCNSIPVNPAYTV